MLDRMRASLANPDHLFTRDQVGYLISMILGTGDEADLAWRAGYEAGYWARVAEENARPIPAGPGLGGEDPVAYRRACEADRTEKYRGGPVEVW